MTASPRTPSPSKCSDTLEPLALEARSERIGEIRHEAAVRRFQRRDGYSRSSGPMPGREGQSLGQLAPPSARTVASGVTVASARPVGVSNRSAPSASIPASDGATWTRASAPPDPWREATATLSSPSEKSGRWCRRRSAGQVPRHQASSAGGGNASMCRRSRRRASP